jgi:hypothetical protein
MTHIFTQVLSTCNNNDPCTEDSLKEDVQNKASSISSIEFRRSMTTFFFVDMTHVCELKDYISSIFFKYSVQKPNIAGKTVK